MKCYSTTALLSMVATRHSCYFNLDYVIDENEIKLLSFSLSLATF